MVRFPAACCGCAILIAIGSCVATAQDLLLFARARAKMNRQLATAPNYVCLETIDRSISERKRKRETPLDVLRLEVAFVGNKELFAWPGSSSFEDRDIGEFAAQGGIIGTGAFVSHAHNLFRTNAPRLVGWEWVEWKGRRHARFRYDVSELVSGYQVRSQGRSARVGYNGNIWIDPETEEVDGFDILATAIPPQLLLQEVRNTITYGNVRIGDATYRLPVSAESTSVSFDGSESHNTTLFSECRQFVGESKLTFDEPATDTPATAKARPALPEVPLPERTEFQIQLSAPLDSRAAKSGDRVEAVLVSDIKQNKLVLFEKGARVEGRVTRLQQADGSTELDVLFTRITGNTAQARFTAVPNEEAAVLPGGFRMVGRMRIIAPPGSVGVVRFSMKSPDLEIGVRQKIHCITVRPQR